MNEIELYNEIIFENIKHIDEYGNEYWLARELMLILQYSNWQNFTKVIDKSKITCINSGYDVKDWLTDVSKPISTGKGKIEYIVDYRLSRYFCYLIAQNGDSRKSVIALAKTYFAIQTRKQELSEREYNLLTEDEKRFYQRDLTRKGNYSLNQTARNAGVKDFAKFHNDGYRGLYNGETADDIAKRKGLRYREDILDNMGSEELVDNLFRITHTEQKLKRDNIQGENNANKVHYEVGKEVRNTLERLNSTMPENLPTPKKSLKELTNENKFPSKIK